MIKFIDNTKGTILFLFSFILLLNLWACHKSSVRKEFFGEFYANDCGESHGGFEWAGSYTASLVINGSKGTLDITFSIGLGDYLKKHKYSVSDFAEAAGSMSFKIEGRKTTLVFTESDQIWGGQYNNYFIGNNSNNLSERIGWIPVKAFEGLRSHYYVELRLKSSEPRSLFSFPR